MGMYVVKKLMNFVVLAEQKVKVNWFIVVFNNPYSRLQDLSAPTKPSVRKDNTKFEAAQIVNIIFQN
jgi:hypothetical protein